MLLLFVAMTHKFPCYTHAHLLSNRIMKVYIPVILMFNPFLNHRHTIGVNSDPAFSQK